MVSDKFVVKLQELEGVLVKQFRMLQKLDEVTKSERAALLKNEVDALLPVVEEKEAILDQLSLIEDDRKVVVQEIALHLNLRSESIHELLPHLDPSEAIPIRRLSEGINTLVILVRDLNYGNQALANSKLDWLSSLQAFMVSVSFPETGYYPPGSPNRSEEPTAFGFEYHV